MRRSFSMSLLARLTLLAALTAVVVTIAWVIIVFAFQDVPYALGVAVYLAEGVAIWAFGIGCFLLIVRALVRGTRRLIGSARRR